MNPRDLSSGTRTDLIFDVKIGYTCVVYCPTILRRSKMTPTVEF